MTVQNLTVETRVDKGEFQTEQVLTISSAHFVHDVYSAFLAPLLPLVIEKMS
jgi:FSR family fosmidomycin resistance protein-like MFS transporter